MTSLLAKLAASILACALLAACTTQDNLGYKQGAGTLIGAGLGGLAGSQIGSGTGRLAATGAGVLLGGLLGSETGASLDRADRLYYERQQRPVATQQVPNPTYYVPPQAAVPAYQAPVASYPTAANCQRLNSNDPFAAPAFACPAANGGWFITH
jgi:surface antigen